MPASRHSTAAALAAVPMYDRLVAAGLDSRIASLLDDMPHRLVQVDPRRPFREPGVARDEVMFVRSGILCKFKTDGSGRRQIVALRFAGEAILPGEGSANYGIQAIVRSELRIGRSDDFNRIVEANPELSRFLWGLVQRNEQIGYEWLVNCGRRDTTARVAHLLCETAARSGVDRNEGTMVNPFTQQQIADITGQTAVNVNRILAELQRQGLIDRKGREIRFRDWAQMRRLGSFQPNYLD